MIAFTLFVALLTIAAELLVLGLIGVVIAVAPKRPVNQALAALLALDGIVAMGGALGIHPALDIPIVGYNGLLYVLAGSFAFCFVYPLFLSHALDTPLTRPLRARAPRVALVVAAALAFLVPFLVPRATLTDTAYHVAEIGWVYDLRPIGEAIALLTIVLFAYGTAAAISNLRRAPRGTPERSRARIYLVAFASQDVGYAIVNVYFALHPVMTTFDLNVFNLVDTITLLAISTLVATGLLRYQLFDFDLKLKRGVARGLVASVFLATFVLVAIVAQAFVAGSLGLLAGALGAGFLLFLITPIRGAADGFADRLFPHVAATPDYVMEKKIGVYREALRESMTAAGVVEADRAADLRKLASSLGLSARDREIVLASLARTSVPPAPLATFVAPGATVLGKYRVERELGAGGGGRAFLGEDVRMHRAVVLKTIPAGEAAATREARAAAAIEHPNVVGVYDIEQLGPEALLVMEYVDGGSLKDQIANGGALSPAAFSRLASDLLAALAAVHAAGAVHRDVKPGNVLLTKDGRAKLSDFGVARLPGFETTIGGVASGSVQYMSPEQARGRRVTFASDLYSAALTLYEARTGRPLFAPLPDETAAEMRMRIGNGRPGGLAVGPPALDAWFDRALRSSPEARFQSAHEMHVALVSALGRQAPETVGS